MALRLATGVLPEWYTPKAEQERVTSGQVKAEEAQAFFLRPLNGPEQLIVQDECIDLANKKIKGRGYTQILSYGLVRWKNVFDENGTAIEYTGTKAIDLLPMVTIAELASKVIMISKFSEETDGKN